MTGSSKYGSFSRKSLGIMVIVLCSWLFSMVAYANSLDDTVVITDYQHTSLAGSWKFLMDDKAEYSDWKFDDSLWPLVKVPSNLSQDVPSEENTVGWYRKWLYLPLAKPAFTLGLELGKIAYGDEVFINGHKIGSSGGIGTNNMFVEKVRIYQIPTEVLHFGDYNLVSIRVKGVSGDNGGIFEGKVAFGNYAELWKELVRTEAMVLIFSGSFMILGVCILIFFIRRSQEYEYLFFGLGALDMGIYTFYVSQWRYILGVENICDSRLYYLSVFFVVPIFLRFAYELLPRSNPPQKYEKRFGQFTKGLLIYGVGIVSGLALYNNIRAWEYVDAYLNNWVIIVASCIGIAYLLYKLTIKDKDALMIFGGCVIAISGGILETIRQFYPNIPPYMATWGLGIFIFSQGMILTNRFLRLHKKVEGYSQSLEKMVDARTKQLQSMEESRRRLLANISHDLRTPVTSVLGHVELLLEEIVESPEQQRTYLKRIHSKMIGLNRLIQDLFELAKIESAQARFQMSELSARGFVKDIYLNYVSDVKNAGFILEYSGEIMPTVLIKADPERLDQVFANLISNAIRYMGEGGVITLRCRLGDKCYGPGNGRTMVVFEVADNGVGIAPEHIPYIFERFYRGSQSRESVAQNSGLGLAIAKEIVEAHGGCIWVDTTVDCGCTICFSLPQCR